AHDVVASIDVNDLTGDAAGQVGEQKGPGLAHLFGGDVSLHRRDGLVELDHRARVAHATHRDGIDRPGAEGVHPHALRAEVIGHVAHHAVERSLADPHHVVAGYDALAAVVGEREHR